MSLAANEFQRALYTRLSDQLDAEVYDHVPQGAEPPYVVIGEDTSIPWRGKSDDGQEFTATIHAWTYQSAGRRAVKALMQEVYEALDRHEEALPMEEFHCAAIWCEFTQTFQEFGAADADGQNYYHAVLRFRALVEAEPVLPPPPPPPDWYIIVVDGNPIVVDGNLLVVISGG